MDTDRSDAKNGKTQLMSLSDLDGRTHAAKRAKQLIDTLTGDHPTLSIDRRLQIVDLAILNAMTEDIATRYFKGEAVDRVEFATLSNAKRRLLSSL